MQPDEPQVRREFSLANLFTDLTRELSTLVRQEAQLIKAEMTEKAADAKAGATEMAVGGAVLLAGFLILLLAAVAGLNQAFGAAALDYPWLSPLVVSLLAMLVGLGFLWHGAGSLRREKLLPERAGESLRRDRDVLKEQFK